MKKRTIFLLILGLVLGGITSEITDGNFHESWTNAWYLIMFAVGMLSGNIVGRLDERDEQKRKISSK